MDNGRYIYLDILKGFSISLVVFCHFVLLPADSFWGNVLMTMAWGAVPCFMMTSGALLLNARSFSWEKFFFKLIKLYVQLATWRLIYYFIYGFIVGFSRISPSLSSVVSYLFLFTDIRGINVGVMWYIRAFIVVYTLYPFLYYIFHDSGAPMKSLSVFLLLLVGVSGIVLPSVNWFLKTVILPEKQAFNIERLVIFTPFTNYANMIFYFALGGLIKKYNNDVLNRLKKCRFFPTFLLISGITMLIVVKFVDTQSFLWHNVYLSRGYTHFSTLLIALGMYTQFMQYQNFNIYCVKKFGQIIGQNTMGIYYLHFLFLGVWQTSQILCVPHNAYSLGANCLKTIFFTIFCAALTIFIKRIPPLRWLVT